MYTQNYVILSYSYNMMEHIRISIQYKTLKPMEKTEVPSQDR